MVRVDPGRPWRASSSSSVRLLDAVLREAPDRKLALHAQTLQLLAPLRPLLHQFQTEFHPQSRHLHLQLRRTHRLQIYPLHRRGEGALRRRLTPLRVERRLLAAHGRDRFLGVGKWEQWDEGGAGGAVVEGAAGLDEGLRDGRSGLQRLQDGRGGEMGPRRIDAYGRDGAVSRRIKAMGAASCWPVTAPPLWQT